MKKKIVLILLICLLIVVIFFVYNKFKVTLDDKAISYAKKYVADNNISLDGSIFVDLKKINDNHEFDNCYNGSGVLIVQEDTSTSYAAYLKCSNYTTPIKTKSKHLKLNGPGLVILNSDEEFSDPGYESDMRVSVFDRDYNDIKVLSYFIIDNGKTVDSLKRVILRADGKNMLINGTSSDDYPVITLNGDSDMNIFYNSEYKDPGYRAMDYHDGDITNLVKVGGSVDSSKIGEYNLNYYVFNSNGLYSSVKRTVRVISNVINFTHDVKLSTEDRTTKVDIILTINGEGYNYTVLPSGNISREKIISYSVTKNDTYNFKIYDVNNKGEDVLVSVYNISDHSKVATTFSANYPAATSNMEKVSSDKLVNYFTSKNVPVSGSTYKVNIDNETYSYDVSNNKLSYSGDFVYCEFYMTNKSSLGSLDNTITLLAGSGERTYGPISSSRIPSNANLNDYSLLITLKKDSDYNMSKHPKMISACTKVGMFLAGIKKGNSIIGYSEGAQAASKTVSYNAVKYDRMVLVNGSAYYTKDVINLISNYAPFRDMEIIMLECKNNNNWNETIIKTINDLMRNGVNSGQISLYTNDNTLITTFNNVINLTVVNNDWSGHGAGYKMIRESNILSYLSSK